MTRCLPARLLICLYAAPLTDGLGVCCGGSGRGRGCCGMCVHAWSHERGTRQPTSHEGSREAPDVVGHVEAAQEGHDSFQREARQQVERGGGGGASGGRGRVEVEGGTVRSGGTSGGGGEAQAPRKPSVPLCTSRGAAVLLTCITLLFRTDTND